MDDTPQTEPAFSGLDMISQSKKSQRLKRHSSQNTSESCLSTSLDKLSEVSKEDLNELHTAYKKCKEVIKKIESKYGHLLQKDDTLLEDILEEENNTINLCTCSFNKKIVFNEDGQQVTRDIVPDLHICPKKPRFLNPSPFNPLPKNQPNLLIEHEFDSLPNDLNELSEILKDETIDVAYRNKVIQKIKLIRLDNINTMRYDRKILIEKLKVKPDSLFEFKGANVSSIPGYPVKPVEEA
ncbi:unnamed protein product [Pieris macdunnoughi]|uniref:Uncharacterized protein n=1 Tax=Pieris macdunnoughi TaxID=345717 RepID=A0A821TY57_9NEOP|nr:unnamed protein product [Pieris macdunnoughi]